MGLRLEFEHGRWKECFSRAMRNNSLMMGFVCALGAVVMEPTRVPVTGTE